MAIVSQRTNEGWYKARAVISVTQAPIAAGTARVHETTSHGEQYRVLCARSDGFDAGAGKRRLHNWNDALCHALVLESLERLVDFGHVFSMELEMALVHQGDEKLFHGEAVAIDMAFSSVLAHVRGHLESETLDLILQTMRGLSLPVYHERFDSPLTAEAIYERVKFSQGQKIPLPTGKGEARIFNDITKEELVEALELWTERCAERTCA